MMAASRRLPANARRPRRRPATRPHGDVKTGDVRYFKRVWGQDECRRLAALSGIEINPPLMYPSALARNCSPSA